MNSAHQKRLTQTVRKAIERRTAYIVSLNQNRENPQVAKMLVELEAERNALDAVLQAIDGDFVMLNIYAEGSV